MNPVAVKGVLGQNSGEERSKFIRIMNGTDSDHKDSLCFRALDPFFFLGRITLLQFTESGLRETPDVL